MPEVTIDVECGDEIHQVSWIQGSLVFHNHDIATEQALVGLGADPPECLDVLDVWRETPRGFETLGVFDGSQMGRIFVSTKDSVSVRSTFKAGEARLRDRIGPLLRTLGRSSARANLSSAVLGAWRRQFAQSLPDSLRAMLVICSLAKLSRTWHSDPEFRTNYRSSAELALSSRAAPAVDECLHSWSPRLSAHAITNLECRLSLRGETDLTGSIGSDGGHADLTLPFDWLLNVWARGLSVVDGCFVMSAGDSDSARIPSTAVRWERRGRRSHPVVADAIISPSSEGGFHLLWVQ